MKNFKDINTTKGNNLGLFWQVNFFALFTIMSLFSGQTSAQRQQACTPTLIVIEDTSMDPGGLTEFSVTSAPGVININADPAGTGLRSVEVIPTSTNVGGFSPSSLIPGPLSLSGTGSQAVGFTAINPNQAVDFTLRAASLYHAVFIRAQCACTPTFTVTDDTSLPPDGTTEFSVASAPGEIKIDANPLGTGLREISVIGTPTNVSFDDPAPLPATYPSGVASETVRFSVIDPNQAAYFKLRAASLYHAVFIEVQCPCTGDANRNRRNR